MQEFSGIELASLLGLNAVDRDPAPLPLLPGEYSIQYQPSVSSGDGKTAQTYRAAVSKQRTVSFKNLAPGQWVATYKVYIASKRTKPSTQKFVAKFSKQLESAKPGSKKRVVLEKVKLKLQAKYKLPFVTNDSPPALFEINE